MTDKPNLTLINMKPLDGLPKESYDEFKRFILSDGLKPSVALRKIMGIYKCDDVHVLSVVNLVRYTYPELDIAEKGFRFKVVDSGYPGSNFDQFNDEDFDKGLEELLLLSANE